MSPNAYFAIKPYRYIMLSVRTHIAKCSSVC